MEPSLCAAIARVQAFTGCDFTASFNRQGKVRPLSVMLKNEHFVSAFAKLGEFPETPTDLVSDLEAFVCALYRKPSLTSVTKARHVLFQQHFAPKRQMQPLEKIKGTDRSSLTPCKAVLIGKVKRANLVAFT